jgi:ATP-dependent helicase Lhr and Lhr-like helicase
MSATSTGSFRSTRRAPSPLSCSVSAAGLLLLWGRGYVEPVTAPPQPRHIVAQQVLALCLQENKIGRAL